MNHLPSYINDKEIPFTSFARLIFILTFVAVTSGCGTITSLTNDHYTREQAIAYEPISYADFHNPPLIYGGVVTDAYFIKNLHPGNIWPIIELGIPVVDACFSFAADTLILPYTSYQQLFTNNDFQKAASTGDLDRVKKLLDAGQDINAIDIYGHTALMNAAWEGHTELVKFLLDKGALTDIQHKYSKATALKYTYVRTFDDKQNNNADIFKLLNKAARTEKVTYKESSLQIAIENADAVMFKTILESGIDKTDGQTLLRSAVTWHKREGRDTKAIVKTLLDAGTKPDFETLSDSLNKEVWPHKSIRDESLANMLFEHGGDPNITDKCGEPLLVHEAWDTENAAYLIRRGANVNATTHVPASCPDNANDEGVTALMRAVDYWNDKTATMFINSGADVNAITPNGLTAMTFAMGNQYKSAEEQAKMVDLLKKAGATR